MSVLFRNLRVHAVFGANTDVGKTIITTALCRSSAASGNGKVHYLKPISTGAPEDADDSHVSRHSGRYAGRITSQCLFRYDEPVSPHLAAIRSRKHDHDTSAPTDAELVTRVRGFLKEVASETATETCAYVETAGGVLSPALSGALQADAYRPLRLPVILVGDSRLGGLSATISAYESLMLRGYDVDAVVLFEEDYYKNWEFLQKWFSRAQRDTLVVTLPSPPARLQNTEDENASMEAYYESVEESGNAVLRYLDERHSSRLDDLATSARRTLDTVWWPFTQHGVVAEEDVAVIDSASGDVLSTLACSDTSLSSSNGHSLLEPVFDGSASWWTQCFGHSNYELNAAAAYAAGRYGHVIFPTASHAPALQLAERLINEGPGKGWAKRCFFTDDGSTGIEVALKMATKAVTVRRGLAQTAESDLGVIGLKGSYHGDTIGAMDACEGSTYNAAVPWYKGRGYWFDPPDVSVRDGRAYVSIPREMIMDDLQDPATVMDPGDRYAVEFDTLSEIYNVEARLTSNKGLVTLYVKHITSTLEALIGAGHSFGALVLEPLLLGAGGMLFVDPLFQRILIDVVRNEGIFPAREDAPSCVGPTWRGLPVVFDEVFVGLGRIGIQPSDVLAVQPDIAVYAKILTGGLVPMSVTLASDDIFRTFWSNNKVDALLHGHSYTAHPIGCAVANKTLDLLAELQGGELWSSARERWSENPIGSLVPPDLRNDVDELADSPMVWGLWCPSFLRRVSAAPQVRQAMAMGTVLSVDVISPRASVSPEYKSGYAGTAGQEFLTYLRTYGQGLFEQDRSFERIHSRSLGNVIYFMSSLNTSRDNLGELESFLESALYAWGSK